MTHTYDVVVVGGGCAGAATTYMLAREGLDVALVERSDLASGCTGHGTGISHLNLRDVDNPHHAELSAKHVRRLAKIIPVVESEAGVDVQYQVGPGMDIPLTEAAWQEMQEIGPKHGRRVLSGEAARELEPGLGPEVMGALWEPYRPRVSGPKLTMAYAKAAKRRGAEIRTHESVLGVHISDGRLVGVKTTRGDISCGGVVFAAGVALSEMGKWLGVEIPVKPIKGEALRLTYHGPRGFHSLQPRGLRPGFVEQGHVLFRADGMVSVGSTTEDTGFEDEPTKAARERLMRMATFLWPDLVNAKIAHHVHGLRPVPRDGLPILGPIPGVEQAHILTGHAAVAHSAVYAEILKDYIMRGTTDVVSHPEAFSLNRFASAQPESEVFGLIRTTKEAETILTGSEK
jgi:glycine/D-amino acid oxidase-like deaminating enzyme